MSDDVDLEGIAMGGFVDILSSVVLVLAFCLMVLILLITVQSTTKSIKGQVNKTSFSSEEIQSIIPSEYLAKFQPLTVIANPALNEELEFSSEIPTLKEMQSVPQYNPKDAKKTTNSKVVEGLSSKLIIGQIPKRIDTKSLSVLEELVLVQKDVLAQQRKVLEQENKKRQKMVQEYQSLLSLITKETELEDIKQDIIPKDKQAFFRKMDPTGERLSGETFDVKGRGSFFLSPPNTPSKSVGIDSKDKGVTLSFYDNSSVLYDKIYNSIKNELSKKVAVPYQKIVISAKTSDYSISATERNRITVERMLLIRSVLLELGVSPSVIKLEPIRDTRVQSDFEDDAAAESEGDYGKVFVDFS